jgi:hypothetical protein
MKAASIQEIKQVLLQEKSPKLVELCLRLARFKKENKELLTYLLFEANDETAFVNAVCLEVDDLFAEMNQTNVYFAKKTIRKIIRQINKYNRFCGSKTAEVEILLHFTKALLNCNLPVKTHAVLKNILLAQLKKIKTVIQTLHEDLQFDYLKQLEYLKV